MNSHSPDERLSAFYDGELSAAERAEVERLVTERSDLLAELSAMAGLSQQLSDLANDLPEVDLRPRVMQQIAAVRPATQRTVVARGVAPRRRWTPLLLMACALTLVVVATLPLLPRSNETPIVANNESHDQKSSDSATAPQVAMASPHMTQNSAREQFSPHDLPTTVSFPAPDNPETSMGGDGDAGLGGGSANRDGTGPSAFLASLERQRDLKAGDIVSHLVEGGDVPMIADYTVVDVERTANSVEILLHEHGIVPLNPADESRQSGGHKSRTKGNASSEIMVYLVEAESASLNTALLECRNLKDVVALSVEPMVPDDDGEAQQAARIGGIPRTADAIPPSAPMGRSDPSVASVAGADQRRVAGAPSLEPEGIAGKSGLKSGPLARKTKPSAETPHPEKPDPEGLTKAMNAVTGDQRLGPVVNGNSLVVEHGGELYSEIKHRQVQLSKKPGRGNYSVKQSPGVDNQPFTQRSKKAESAESIFAEGRAQPSEGNQLSNGLQYGNSLNTTGFLNRQRAILVLRSQLPPPPPEPTHIPPE